MIGTIRNSLAVDRDAAEISRENGFSVPNVVAIEMVDLSDSATTGDGCWEAT